MSDPPKAGYSVFAGDAPRLYSFSQPTRLPLQFLRLTQPPLQLIRGNHEPFNRFALNESIHNLRDVGDRDGAVKKVIGFD